MLLPHCVVSWMLITPVMLVTSLTCSQSYPSKPIRMVTGGVGGSSDFVVRLVAQGLTDGLGQQVIVDNRSAGVMPGLILSKAPPDGYTLLLFGPVSWIGPLLQKSSYDAVTDFAPISFVTRAPNLLVVTPSLPVKSVKELIALAKAKPGALSYGAAGVGGSAHLATELFKSMSGTDIVHIPYKSGGALAADLIGGQVQLSFGTAGTMASHVKSGRLRALAVTSLQPSALAPGLPTVAAVVPGYEAEQYLAAFTPQKTPAAIISRLNQEVGRYLRTSDAKEKLFNQGVEAYSSAPEAVAATVKSDVARIVKLIKEAGIAVE